MCVCIDRWEGGERGRKRGRNRRRRGRRRKLWRRRRWKTRKRGCVGKRRKQKRRLRLGDKGIVLEYVATNIVERHFHR